MHAMTAIAKPFGCGQGTILPHPTPEGYWRCASWAIARIVDEADVVQEIALEPAAPGLDTICRGLQQISPDDHVALERGALVYDALYAQLRDTS